MGDRTGELSLPNAGRISRGYQNMVWRLLHSAKVGQHFQWQRIRSDHSISQSQDTTGLLWQRYQRGITNCCDSDTLIGTTYGSGDSKGSIASHTLVNCSKVSASPLTWVTSESRAWLTPTAALQSCLLPSANTKRRGRKQPHRPARRRQQHPCPTRTRHTPTVSNRDCR